MKLDKLVGDRFKERPSDCQIDSHAIMDRKYSSLSLCPLHSGRNQADTTASAVSCYVSQTATECLWYSV